MKPSIELFEAVMGFDVHSVSDAGEFYFYDAKASFKLEQAAISKSDFAFKCKEWAWGMNYIVNSTFNFPLCYAIAQGRDMVDIEDDDCVGVDEDERNAIIKLCEWILKKGKWSMT